MSQYPLRLPDYIMEQARTAAEEDNVSVNQMFLSLISEGIGHRRALRGLRDRAQRGDTEKALAILDGLPDLPPDPDDTMPEDRH
jgi:hypothetical protein